jgi:hypothetical protein
LFVNDLISIAEVAGADLAKLGSTLMPKEFLCNSLILNFFDKFLYLNIDLDDVNQDAAIRLELFSNMLKLVKDSAFRYGIIDSLLKKRENDGESGSILNSLSKSLASDSEQVKCSLIAALNLQF